MLKRFPFADKNRCVACGVCASVCPKNAVEIYKGRYATFDIKKCVGCKKCFKSCPIGCISAKEVEVDEG